MNIIFETNFRETHNMVFDYGTTIDITLKQFLKKIGRPDLINGDSNQISFLFTKEDFVSSSLKTTLGNKILLTLFNKYWIFNFPSLYINC